MGSISKPPQTLNLHRYSSLAPNHCPVALSLPLRTTASFRARLGALKTGSGGGRSSGGSGIGPELLRKPVVSPRRKGLAGAPSEEEDEVVRNRNYNDDDEEEEEDEEEDNEKWVDWEDKILEDTVPLVGFVRMILHSETYESGDRLSPEHEKTILERLLPFHPEFEKKTGCGIDYITVGYHPDFERSRCMFIVQKDGKLVDFSYWKCIKGMIRKNYPLYADTFILRHFRQRRKRDL